MNLNKALGRVATTLVAATMLASVTAVPAFAESAGNDETTTKFTKKLDMTNAEGASVPALKYTYEIGTTGVAAVNATTGNPAIKVGVGNLTITNEVTFTSDDLDKDVIVTIPENTYTEPGIYRYKVTEKDNTKNIAGMSNVDGDDDYYLDVYVEDQNDQMKATSFVWTRTAITPNLVKGEDDKWYAVYGDDEAAAKLAKVTEDVDTYTTYDLTVTKKTSGTMANDGGTFSFTVYINSLANDTTVSVDGKASSPAKEGKITVNKDIVAPGEAGKNFVIKGIPADAIYDVIENLPSTEGYTVSAVVNGGDSSELTYNETDSGYKVSVDNLGNEDNTIVITNTREAVTPTGIVMNVAPYVLLVVVAAAGCFVFLRKRRED